MERLKENTNVFFDPVSHSYTNEAGELLLGVTSLLEKHGLAPDLSGIPASRLKEAAEKGTRVHEYLQAYEAGEMVPTSDLLDAYKELGLHHLASEFLISDNELVASKIDMIYQSGPSAVIIVDIKTSEKKNIRYVTWQTSIYKVLLERQCPGIEVTGTYLLWCDKKCEKLRAFERLEPIPEAEVDALLDAEKNGLIYIDENAGVSADLVLEEAELSTYIAKADEIAQYKAKIKEIEAALKGYDERMLAYMAEHNLDELQAPGGVFKRKAAYTQTRVDSAKLQKSWPAIYEKCAKTIDVAASLSFKPNK